MNVRIMKRSPQFAAAIKEFEAEVEPAVLQRIYAVKGEWRADGWIPNVFGYVIDGTNHALAILYATPGKILDWELDDSVF